MAVIVQMPKLSDTMEEGGIAGWQKKEGDFVEEGDLLLDIETDKATMEYSSPEEGTLLKILVQPGDTVSLGAPIAIIGEKGEQVDLGNIAKADVAAPKPEVTSAEVAVAPSPSIAAAPEGRHRSSPLARKMAKEKGVEVLNIAGSGPGGRVVARDIETLGATPAPTLTSAASSQTIPLSMMRKTIAKRLVSAKNEAPHFYLTVSASMSAGLKWRQDLNDSAEVQAGRAPKVSVNDLILLAVSRALLKHPEVNASWQGDHLLQHESCDVCFAVALPSGLITPAVRGAEKLGIREIAARTRDLATRAKDGSIAPEEYSGGSITVSNLGMTLVEEFTAIINPPQSAILAIGRTQRVPWVDEEGQVISQTRMKMTMSCDHRVIDGMVGARFLETLVAYLESPLAMLS